jgi:hypothetical protein
MADRHTGIAAKNKYLFKGLDHGPDFFQRLLLTNNHYSFSFLQRTDDRDQKLEIKSGKSKAYLCLSAKQRFFPDSYLHGEGPSFRIRSVNSLHICAHCGPMAAERLYISILDGSRLTS